MLTHAPTALLFSKTAISAVAETDMQLGMTQIPWNAIPELPDAR